jgi:hypothetical protein
MVVLRVILWADPIETLFSGVISNLYVMMGEGCGFVNCFNSNLNKIVGDCENTFYSRNHWVGGVTLCKRLVVSRLFDLAFDNDVIVDVLAFFMPPLRLGNNKILLKCSLMRLVQLKFNKVLLMRSSNISPLYLTINKVCMIVCYKLSRYV